jgi:hypothetical protein
MCCKKFTEALAGKNIILEVLEVSDEVAESKFWHTMNVFMIFSWMQAPSENECAS